MRYAIFVSHRRLTLIGFVLAIGILAASGYVIAVAASSVTASATDTIVGTTASTVLSTTGAVETTVLTLTLPGSATSSRHYVLTASGDAVNFGPSDYTRCQTFVNSTQIAAVSMIVGNPAATGAQGPAGFLSTFAEVGGVDIPAGTASETATLQCEHDFSLGATPYIDAGASLMAHRTSSLKVATEP